jgi:alpha-tubulin suppressor-like RCC1 family protein
MKTPNSTALGLAMGRVFGAVLLFTGATFAQVPQVSIVTSFTGVVLPPQVTVVPVQYKVNGGTIRSMDVPLSCTTTQCTGSVVVVDSLYGTGSQAFTVARSTNPSTAFPLNLLQDRQQLSTDRTHTLQVINGQVWAFGWNQEGELGLGYMDSAFHPMLRRIPNLTKIVSVAAGREFSVALDSAGDVWTWGSDFLGALGNGSCDPDEAEYYNYLTPRVYNTFFSNPFPQRVLVGQKVVSIAAGPNHVVVADSAGRVWGWGYSINGILGWSAPSDAVPTPTLAPGLTGIWRVSAGGDRYTWEAYPSFSLALGWNGSLWGMGIASNGQMGPVIMANSGAVQVVLDLSTFPALTGPVSLRSGEAATLLEYVRIADGKRMVLAMGYNQYNSLTNPMTNATVPGIQGSGSIDGHSVGGNISTQILSESTNPQGAFGQVWWRGQTIANATLDWVAVQRIDGRVLEAKEVQAGHDHGVAADTSGTAYCWGEAYPCTGQGSGWVGYATVVSRDSSPAPLPATITITSNLTGLVLPPQVTALPILYTVDGGAQQEAEVPLNCSSTVCQGSIVYSDGRGVVSKSFTVARSTNSSAAFPLNFLQDREPLSTDQTHTLVVRNGKVWAFGWNREGALGLGYTDTLFHSELENIPNLTGIVSVAAGREFSVALDSAGDVWTWGSNFQGTLGNGTDDPSEIVPNPNYNTPKSYNSFYSNPIPQRVLIGQKVVSIAAGPTHVMVADSSGKVWGWGYDGDAQLGWSTSSGKVLVPTVAPGISGIRIVTGGGDRTTWEVPNSFSLALGWNGSVWGMGIVPGQLTGPILVATSGAQQIPLNVSEFPALTGPLSIRTGAAASLFEYLQSTDGERVVLALGQNQGNNMTNLMMVNSSPVFQATGPLSGVSMGYKVSTQVAMGVPLGSSGLVSWEGWTAANRMTEWTPVLKTDGTQLSALEAQAGNIHGVSLDSSSVYCWGETQTCAGIQSTTYQAATLIPVDTSSLLAINIPGVPDTLYVPDFQSGLVFQGNVGSDSFSVPTTMVCDSFSCKAFISVRLPNGHIVGREINVKKVGFTDQQIALPTRVFSGGSKIQGSISNKLKGTLSFQLVRFGGTKPTVCGIVGSIAKTVDSLSFSLDYSSQPACGLNGDYALRPIITGTGWTDTAKSDFFSKAADPMILDVERTPDKNLNRYLYNLTDSIPIILTASRFRTAGGQYMEDTIQSGVLALSPGDSLKAGIVRTDSLEYTQTANDNLMEWNGWIANEAYRLNSSQGVTNYSLAISCPMDLDRVLDVGWNQAGIDSARVGLYSSSGGLIKDYLIAGGTGPQDVKFILPGTKSAGYITKMNYCVTGICTQILDAVQSGSNCEGAGL